MIFKELNIKQKSRMGSGTYKDVYNLSTRPDLVVKVFDRLSNESIYDVQIEEELSKKYPKLFTKILKVDYKKGYMIQEKLDVDNWLKDISDLEQEIRSESSTFNNIEIVAYLYNHLLNKTPNAIKAIKDILKNNKNKILYNKLIKYLNELIKLRTSSRNLDVHVYNMGYDKQDNIKMFDI